jgi:N-acetyl-anhydromuramoyl-L-alanine amidase
MPVVASASDGVVPAGDAVWNAGWWSAARRVDSPNFGARPAGCHVTLALLHSISLPPGEYGGDTIERLFTNRLDWDAHPYYTQIRGATVSSHFVIRRAGELLQFVSCDARAWHAGASCWRERENCNDYAVGIELEGLEGRVFESAQYRVLVRLLNALARQHPIDSVAGHEHVAPARKQDPGAGFDWRRLMAMLDWPDRYFPEDVTKRI